MKARSVSANYAAVVVLALLRLDWAMAVGADPSTLEGKVMFGYQGWFLSPQDGGNVGWRHWSSDEKVCNASTVSFDLWPDMSEYRESEKTGLVYGNGTTATLFSALHPSTVDKHFEWLQQFNLDGVFLQRFLGELSDPRFFAIRNNVTRNVMASAESRGRTFAIMYDISGVNEGTLVSDMKNDWNYLVNQLKVVNSPAYQHHNGKPVVVIWGLGFTDRPGTAAQTIQLVQFFQNANIFIMGGVPFFWRSGTRDSKSNFLDAYLSFDALSPWSIGRYGNAEDYANLFNSVIFDDKEFTFSHGKIYAPVTWPGGSNANPTNNPNNFNNSPRKGGDFFRSQANTLVDRLRRNESFVYLAMFDEVDEGTAMFKAASQKSDIPVDKQFLYLSIDGINLPSDYYLQLASDLSNRFKQPTSDKLSSTGVLKQAPCLRSASNVYRACMQGDGNLVISFQSNNTVRWALGPASSSGPFQLVMQGDGNVVIYNGSGKPIWASANDPTWSARLSTSTGPYQLIIQDDGDLVARDKNMLVVFSALQTPIIWVNKTLLAAMVQNS